MMNFLKKLKKRESAKSY